MHSKIVSNIEEVKARGWNLDIKNPHAVEADHGDPETLLAELDAIDVPAAKPRKD